MSICHPYFYAQEPLFKPENGLAMATIGRAMSILRPMNFDSVPMDDAMAGLLPVPPQSALLLRPPRDRHVKRPHNPYNLFFIDRQQIERDLNPNLSGNEVSQLIGRKWSEMDENARRPYVERAKAIRDRFREENPDYHYQKGEKSRKLKRPTEPLFEFQGGADGQKHLEAQLRNLFMFLGAQAIASYVSQNKPLMEEATALVKSVTLPGAGGLDDPMDFVGLNQ
jgi:hypothetical protein